ncbi:MAG: S-layer homology domain-containing protein [Clostridia bacterium]|nr:S-layer homology domain-containing protein [Clostridia bacterium]
MKLRTKIISVMLGLVMTVSATAAIGANSAQQDEISALFGGKKPTLKDLEDNKEKLKAITLKRFKDVKEGVFYITSFSLPELLGAGGISGYPDGTFRPNANIKTGEYIKLLVASMGYTAPPAPKGKPWYTGYVDVAKNQLKIISSQDNYNYDSNITRLDMVKLECKILGLQIDANDVSPIFTDAQGTGDERWLNLAFKEMLFRGFYDGKNRTAQPNATATRGQVAETVIRALQYRDNPELFKIKQREYYANLENGVKPTVTPAATPTPRPAGSPPPVTPGISEYPGDKTKQVMNGFVIPKMDYTSLGISGSGNSKDAAYFKEHDHIDIDIMTNVVLPDLDKQLQQLREIITPVLSPSAVSRIMDYTERKKTRKDLFNDGGFWSTDDNRAIALICGTTGVQIIIFEVGFKPYGWQ